MTKPLLQEQGSFGWGCSTAARAAPTGSTESWRAAELAARHGTQLHSHVLCRISLPQSFIDTDTGTQMHLISQLCVSLPPQLSPFFSALKGSV